MNKGIAVVLVIVAGFLIGLWAGWLREPAPVVADAAPPASTMLVGATLLPGLGSGHFPVSSRHPEVQRWFDQGLALTWGFNHEAAERSFLKATVLDPDCAMCWWGAALVLGPHVNAPMDATNNGKAWTRIVKARELSPKATPREQAFIAALSARYAEQPPADRRPLDEAYAEALAAVVKAAPDDLDAAVFFAEALMDLQPWNYYEVSGAPRGRIGEVVAALESVMQRKADHAGALHLYIHAVEASTKPELGVAAADRLRELLPGSGHLVHMPAHIYTRVGRYHDAVLANRLAVSADDQFLATCRPGIAVYPLAYVPHNHHFLWWAASTEGASAEAIASADETAKRAHVEALIRQPDFLFLQDFLVTPLKARAQLGRWDEIVAMPKPAEDLAYPTAIWHYARGLAAVRQSRLDEADAHLAALATAAADPAWEQAFIGPQHTLAGPLRIAERLLAGEVAAARRDYPAALVALRQGVALEDGLAYTEPPLWHQPVRRTLGTVQLLAGQPAAAETSYREDLDRHRDNGWSLFGLAQALRAQERSGEAAAVDQRFEQAWQHADLRLEASRL
jgi:tetratricopeptide (TPR) repeat protein